jgi:hypothetical protein
LPTTGNTVTDVVTNKFSLPGSSTLIVVAPDTSPFGHLNLRSPPWAVGVLTGDQFTPLPTAFAHYTGEIAW